MSLDIKKLKADELKKLSDSAKQGKSGEKAIASARKALQELLKDSKTLSDLAKKNPDV